MPRVTVKRTRSVWPRRPSLRIRFARWVSAVRPLIASRAPISAFLEAFTGQVQHGALSRRERPVEVDRLAAAPARVVLERRLRQGRAQIPSTRRSLAHGPHEFSRARVLQDVPVRAIRQRLEDIGLVRVHREYDRARPGRTPAHFAGNVGAAQARHHHVRDENGRLEALDERHRLEAVGSLADYREVCLVSSSARSPLRTTW